MVENLFEAQLKLAYQGYSFCFPCIFGKDIETESQVTLLWELKTLILFHGTLLMLDQKTTISLFVELDAEKITITWRT